jgi:hypothetical protein
VSISIRGICAVSMAWVAFTLSGCTDKPEPAAEKPDKDPALASSLQGPVITDPDLDHLNNARQAISGGGAPVIELPPIETGADAIAAAKSDAAKIAKKTIASLPPPQDLSDQRLRDAITPAQLARSITGPGKNCGDKIEYGYAWSLRLPEFAAIYPRGHVLEAAGTDRDNCRLRVVSFASPVDPADIMAFYETRFQATGLSVQYRQSDAVQVLEGSKAGAAYRIRTRKISAGVTGVDIVVNGS